MAQTGYWKAPFQRGKERGALAPSENRGAGGDGQTTGTPTLRHEVGEEESSRDIFGLRRRRETPSRPARAAIPGRSAKPTSIRRKSKNPAICRKMKSNAPGAGCLIWTFRVPRTPKRSKSKSEPIENPSRYVVFARYTDRSSSFRTTTWITSCLRSMCPWTSQAEP